MIDRYANKRQAEIWSTENQLTEWQNSELAAIFARAQAGQVVWEDYLEVKRILESNHFDISRWLEIEAELHHDLQAFVEERREYLPERVEALLHFLLTSYDTEEPAFVRRLSAAVRVVMDLLSKLESLLKKMARQYQHCPMNLRSHGQEGEVGTFGKRILGWLAPLQVSIVQLQNAAKWLVYSKMSGAMGNYGGLSPELERAALAFLDLKPFPGATQIMPRTLYLPTAEALCAVMENVAQIAMDIRLASRSGLPLMREFFAKL
jgi:adenylosuccinate lyase